MEPGLAAVSIQFCFLIGKWRKSQYKHISFQFPELTHEWQMFSHQNLSSYFLSSLFGNLIPYFQLISCLSTQFDAHNYYLIYTFKDNIYNIEASSCYIHTMLLQATIIRHYFAKTQTSVASFGPPGLSIIFSNGMYLEVSPL